jgi:hypothetical protein
MARPKIQNRGDHFWSLILVTPTGCWEWQGTITSWDYGHFWDGKYIVRAHKYAYEAYYGRVPFGKIIHHKCENKKCVYPLHLEATTKKDHPDAIYNVKKQQTHCWRGHEFNEENTYLIKNKNKTRRNCKMCMKIRDQKSHEAEVTYPA